MSRVTVDKRPLTALDGPAEPHVRKRYKTEAIIASLLAGKTIKATAKDCGLAYTTLKVWFASDWFRTEYQEAKDRLLDTTINQLRTSGAKAVAALRRVIADAESPPAAKVSAARALLELQFRAVEVQDLSARLEKLEKDNNGGYK